MSIIGHFGLKDGLVDLETHDPGHWLLQKNFIPS